MPQKRTDKNGKTRWIGRYRDKNKKEYTRSFPTRREAKQWEDERKTQVTKGTHVTPQREKTTILEMYDAWTTRDLSDGTLLSYAQTRRELQDSIGAAKPSTPPSQTSTNGTSNSSTAAHGWTTKPWHEQQPANTWSGSLAHSTSQSAKGGSTATPSWSHPQPQQPQ